ncbi:hypothetical protein FQR65_LT20597 [Abscondita terminalis]|nr:hypothetical protein FQR65_LT20597 [Abscondita terminalis]
MNSQPGKWGCQEGHRSTIAEGAMKKYGVAASERRPELPAKCLCLSLVRGEPFLGGDITGEQLRCVCSIEGSLEFIAEGPIGIHRLVCGLPDFIAFPHSRSCVLGLVVTRGWLGIADCIKQWAFADR